MLVVPDINVIVSGYLWSGPSSRIIEAARRGDVFLATDHNLLGQLREVLSRSRFASRLSALGLTVDAVIDDFAALAKIGPLVDSEHLTAPLRDGNVGCDEVMVNRESRQYRGEDPAIDIETLEELIVWMIRGWP